MNRYTVDQVFERDGYTVEVMFAPCDLSPYDLYDDSCYDIEDICEDINRGAMDWLDCKVAVSLEGVEVGEASLGGLLYRNYREAYTDGVVDDLIDEAIADADPKIYHLAKAFTAKSMELDAR